MVFINCVWCQAIKHVVCFIINSLEVEYVCTRRAWHESKAEEVKIRYAQSVPAIT